jgi:exoribonuclease R
MTYDQADNILHDKPPEDPGTPTPPPLTAGSPVNPKLIGALKSDLSMLTQLSRKLRNDREQIGGAVDLSDDSSSNELKFTLESGTPVKVATKKDKEIHHTIAEMMIMANTAVAERIQESFPETALLRIHQPVEEPRIEELKSLLEAAGVKLDSTQGNDFAKCLREAQMKASSSSFRSLLLRVATRAMTEAQYICTGSRKNGSEFSHFGLGLEKYTHFTSPIRRYADVIVHKQLLASLDPNFVTFRIHRPMKTKIATVKPVEALPKSNVISILAGEGLTEEKAVAGHGKDIIDGSKESSHTVNQTHDQDKIVASSFLIPYVKSEVSSICETLNHHNRLAKRSSYECQSLFLSLYFKSHTERTQGVVTSLRGTFS